MWFAYAKNVSGFVSYSNERNSLKEICKSNSLEYGIEMFFFRSLLCGETSQRINLSFASSLKESAAASAPLTATEVSMPKSMAINTPTKLIESPLRNRSGGVASSWPGVHSVSPVSSLMMESSPGSSGFTPDNATEAKRARAGSLIDNVTQSARMVIEVFLVLFCVHVQFISDLQQHSYRVSTKSRTPGNSVNNQGSVLG